MLFDHANEFVAEGDRVVMIGRCGWRHKKTGKEVETPVFAYWNFRDGKVAEYFEFYDTAKAFAATRPG
jgi:ketosteroid isomerase-like protein